ncbi:MAG: preprotein translocase subunit SecE [Chromatiales bacterium]|nr:preprotein translocase subunit SecE [Chromatiales bacterium]
MGARVESAGGMPDAVKWALAALIALAGIGGFYALPEVSYVLRIVALLAVFGGALVVAAQTEKGRAAWEVVREARTEVRKVVWPSRRETLQTTGIVMAMVTVVAIFLWMLDGLLAWIVRSLLGTGG